MVMAMIHTQGLAKAFHGRRGTVQAVRGVDLQVREGELFGFLGPNGAGKTTTMRMLATLLDPSGGRAWVAGRDLLRQPRLVRAQLGYVSQSGGAEPLDTARESLVLQARLHRMHRRAAQARAAELLEALQLSAVADRPAQTYSGGQRRRLDLAMGMAHRPRLLLLDEPTAGLDPHSRVWLWDEIRRLRDAGTTVFVTTHYLEEADALCDRLAIIDGGRIISTGTPEELKRQLGGEVVWLGLQADGGRRSQAIELLHCQPGVRALRDADDGLQLTVERGEEALPRLLRLLDGAGMPIRTATLARPTLDDVFLRLTGRSLRERETELT
jgi:ABC-2 type transport system ATP-binding protein